LKSSDRKREKESKLNKVRTRSEEPGNLDKSNGSSEDSVDDEDTGETSEHDSDIERKEGKNEKRARKYKLAHFDQRIWAEKQIKDIEKSMSDKDKLLGITTDQSQRVLQKYLIEEIHRQSFEDTQTESIYYPKCRLILNKQRVYNPDLVAKVQRQVFVPNCKRYDGNTGR